jgi:hypothetical protein
MRKSKTEKELDKRIERAYYAACNGIAINLFDIPKVFDHGKKVIAAGADDAKLQTELRSFVETIRV